MASDLNRLTIIGRLTRDPELKHIQSGSAVASFSIANNKTYTANGEKKTEVSYFDVVIWGKMAEVVSEYLAKGSQVAIEGRLQQRRWEQDGNKRSKVEIVADNVQFLDSKKAKQDTPEGSIIDSGTEVPDNPFSDDNIPF